MKVYIYSQFQKMIEKSGVGRAIYHQKKALERQGVQVVDRKEDADVIHINTIFPGSVSVAMWAKRHGKAVVFHAHSTKEDFANSYVGSNQFAGLFGRWITYCYQLGDNIITPSRYSKQLLRTYGIKKPVHVISNGIDTSYYQRLSMDRSKFREKYGYKDSDKVIMSVGLWIERKGILDFVELAKRMPEYQFIWFGQSDLRTVPAKAREAVETKLPNLHFAGYVGKEELRQAYAACDLFLFPSYEETEGIVVLEALAMKIPVLLRDIPVYDGWIYNGFSAYMAEDNEDFEKLTKGILEKEMPSLVENGYEVAEQRDIGKIGERLLQVYEEACQIRQEKYLSHMKPVPRL